MELERTSAAQAGFVEALLGADGEEADDGRPNRADVENAGPNEIILEGSFNTYVPAVIALHRADTHDAEQGIHRVKLDEAATERVAATLVQIDSGGMCEYKKICQLCDCHLKYAPDTISIRDGYAADNARLIINAIKETS